MKGDPKVLEYLNAGLKNELTAINQYFLHARMFENWGFKALGKVEYEESIDEMKHADVLTQRILLLDGLPNLQDIGRLRIGENVRECLEADLQAEHEGHALYKEAIGYCESVGDYVTREIFVRIQEGEEHHIDWIETQLSLMDSMGEQNYLQSAMGAIEEPDHG